MAYWYCDKHDRPLDVFGCCSKCWEEEDAAWDLHLEEHLEEEEEDEDGDEKV